MPAEEDDQRPSLFSESFWTHDYIGGVNVLVEKLKQGIAENSQVLAMIQGRIRVETMLANELAQLARTAAPAPKTGFAKDQGGVLSDAYDVYLTETSSNAILHSRIASKLETKLREPLAQWFKGHSKRISECEARLRNRVQGYQRLLEQVKRQKQVYYHQSRRQEDGVDTSFEPVASTIRIFREKYLPVPTPSSEQENESPDEVVLAGLHYTQQQFSDLIARLLDDVTMQEYRVPLLGIYGHVSSGASIASTTRRHLKNDSIAYSEKFGQGLVDRGFLKPVGQISNRFQSSHSSHYQWQQSALDLFNKQTPRLEEIPNLPPAPREASEPAGTPDSVASQKSSRSSSEGHNDGGKSPKLITEGEHYLQSVLELDLYRCEMEEEMIELFNYLERCEIDRVGALKQALWDLALLSQRPEQQREIQSRELAAQSAIDAVKDVQTLVDTYQTGPLVPNVTVYQGYNDSVCQTFGVDLIHSAFFVPLVLDYLTKQEISIETWTSRYELRDAYKLRCEVNNGREFEAEATFKFFPKENVAAVLLQFLLELPESVLPFTIYDKVKTIYDFAESNRDDPNYDHDAQLLSALLHIPKHSLTVLEKLTTYFARYGQHELIAEHISLYMLRPRAISALTRKDQHPKLFLTELLQNGPKLFAATRQRAEALSKERERAASSGSLTTPRRHVSTPTQFVRSPLPDASSTTSSPLRESSLIPLSLTPERDRRTIDAPRSRGIDVTRGLGISSRPSNLRNDSSQSSAHSAGSAGSAVSPVP